MFGFFIKNVLPAFLAMLLFVIAFFFIIIPAYERRIMEDKKEMLRELTDTAWSDLEEVERMEREGKLTKAEARKQAAERIRDLRYGTRRKDYFWITDLRPKMIMHPYRPDLEGKDLKNYTGYGDKRLFAEFAEIAKTRGYGFSEYLWQWKDDPSKVAPKLSYVKLFKPWGWIIGTGIYLNDVRDEIDAMERRLTFASLGIVVVIGALLFYGAMQSLKTERRRLDVEEKLRISREKYKALVGVSTEGLVIFLDGDYFYANRAMVDLMGCASEDELFDLDVFGLRGGKDAYFEALMAGRDVPEHVDASLKRRDGSIVEVVLYNAKIPVEGKEGIVLIVRDGSGEMERRRRESEEERERLIIELQTALLFMNQPVERFISAPVRLNMNISVKKLAEQMRRKNVCAALLTTEEEMPVGIVTDKDIAERAVAAGMDGEESAYKIMSSPIIDVPGEALVFEAALLMSEKNIRNLAVRDRQGELIGMVGIKDLFQVQRYSSASLFQEIETAADADAIADSVRRVPRLVKALVDSGAKAGSITRILSTVSDLVHRRLIEFALDELGEPPVLFSFLTLGSEGRGEETLATDQDNAIIYLDPPKEKAEEVAEYFLKFGEKVCGWLNQVGYKYCTGEVMAKNPKWCCPASVWRRYFADWVVEANPENLLEFHIFFDFRHCYGDSTIPESMRKWIDDLLTENRSFFLHMAQNCLLYKPPVNMFGSLVLKGAGSERTFNIKEAIKPIINFARIHALENGVRETNTLKRLERLVEKRVLSEATRRDMVEAYNYLMQIRLKHQVANIETGEKPNNDINPVSLTNIEREMIKKVLSQIAMFQSNLSFHFKGTM